MYLYMGFSKFENDKLGSIVEWIAIAPWKRSFYVKYTYLEKAEHYTSTDIVGEMLFKYVKASYISEKFAEKIVSTYRTQHEGSNKFRNKLPEDPKLLKVIKAENDEIEKEGMRDLPGRENYPWFILPDSLEELTKIAGALLKHMQGLHDKITICGLGQSPAWVIEAAGNLPHDGIEFGDHIPFSGSLIHCGYQSENPRYNEGIYCYNKPREKENVTREEIKAYRNTLDMLGLNPAKIAGVYRDEGMKLAIVDYISTGNGLASFLKIMFDWVNEFGEVTQSSFKEALIVVDMIDKYSMHKVRTVSLGKESIECKPLIEESGFLFKLGKGVDEGEASERLVKSYKHTKWQDSPEFTIENPDFISFIKGQVALAAKSHLAQQAFAVVEESKDNFEPSIADNLPDAVLSGENEEAGSIDIWFSNT